MRHITIQSFNQGEEGIEMFLIRREFISWHILDCFSQLMKMIVHSILSDYIEIIPVAEIENILPDQLFIVEDTIPPKSIVVFFVNNSVLVIIEEDLIQLGVILFCVIISQN